MTFKFPMWNGCMVQADGVGCYIGFLSEGSTAFSVGDRVRVRGNAVKGGFAPSIDDARVVRLGAGEVPEPVELDRGQRSLRELDNLYVATEGVIRSIQFVEDTGLTTLGLVRGSERLNIVTVGELSEGDQRRYLDAYVRVRAVCGTQWNLKSQFVAFSLSAASLSNVEILSPSPTGPFARDLLSMRDALRVGFDFSGQNRVKVRGVVTRVNPDGSFYVQDVEGEFLVRPFGAGPISVGDVIEIAGYATARDFSPMLEDALVRHTGEGGAPSVVEVALDATIPAVNDCRLIAVEGDLSAVHTVPDSVIYQIRERGVSFSANLPLARGRSVPSISPGARLRLTGVARIEADSQDAASEFELLMRGPDDVTVLVPGPWWTLRKAGVLLGVVTLIFLLAATVILRRESLARTRYEKLFQDANDLIFAHDLQGRVLDCNPATERATGFPRSELVGSNWYGHLEPSSRKRLSDDLARLKPGRETGVTEFQLRDHEGRGLWLEGVVRLKEEKDDGATAEWIARDITARRAAETDLERTQRELRDAAHRAGMSEIATGVLHNVGNVLNSVNVSASMIRESLHRWRFDRLAKVADLLIEKNDELADFLANDPKGRQIPAYLKKFAEAHQTEQSQVLIEVADLEKNLDHIKEVVAMQQTYAKSGVTIEEVRLPELIADAVRLNKGAMERHQINLATRFEELPPIAVDRHKVLQILVNLIRNAKHACQESDQADRLVEICLRREEDSILIEVRDNGIGIPGENLVKIFHHGFTTRKQGHGFGLHSCANAAGQMGGRLWAQSDGVGKGAVFMLKLPLAKQNVETT